MMLTRSIDDISVQNVADDATLDRHGASLDISGDIAE